MQCKPFEINVITINAITKKKKCNGYGFLMSQSIRLIIRCFSGLCFMFFLLIQNCYLNARSLVALMINY